MPSAGRILIMPKGDYKAGTEYEMLDMVYHNGTSWIAKQNVSNIEPSEANAKYWQNMFDIKSGTTRITQNPNGNDYIDCTLDIPNGQELTFVANVIASDTIFVIGVSVIDLSATQTRVIIKLNQSVEQDLIITVGWHQ